MDIAGALYVRSVEQARQRATAEYLNPLSAFITGPADKKHFQAKLPKTSETYMQHNDSHR